MILLFACIVALQIKTIKVNELKKEHISLPNYILDFPKNKEKFSRVAKLNRLHVNL